MLSAVSDCGGVALTQIVSLAAASNRQAIEVAASQRQIKHQAGISVDAEIDLNVDDGNYFLSASLNVSVPGVDPVIARELLDAAHSICPYSKATHGHINVATNLI